MKLCMATVRQPGQGQTEWERSEEPGHQFVYPINDHGRGSLQGSQGWGKEKGVVIVSVDGGCQGIRDIRAGHIAATAQQYPLKMAALGVAAGVSYIRTGKKPSGYTDTGVALIAARPVKGVESKDVKTGMELCFGDK